MAEKQIRTRIVHKHDTEANWNLATNFIPKQGELIIYDKDLAHPNTRFKIGDGKTVAKDLPFTDLEKTIKQTDTTTTYTKEVPANSASYAELTKLGGMTRKCTNLLPYPYVDTTKTENGVTFTDNGDGSITINGTASQTTNFRLVKDADAIFANGDYHVKLYNGIVPSVALIIGGLTSNVSYLNTVSQSVSITTGTMGYFLIQIPSGATISNITVYPMLNEGDTALPYEPYFEGLRSAPVTEVESVGVNLWKPFTTQSLNGVALTVDENGVCTLNGTCAASANFTVDGGTLDAGTYWLSDNAQGTFSNDNYARVQVHFVATGLSLQTENNHASNKTVVMTLKEPTYYSRRIRIEGGHTYTNCKLYPMLNKGTTAKPYTPYQRNTLPIPEAVQALDGYGWGVNESVYNYIDYEKKQFVKRVGKVDMGTRPWTKESLANNKFRFTSYVLDIKFSANAMTKANVLCAVADVIPDADSYYGTKYGFAVSSSSSTICLSGAEYDGMTADQFTAAMSGVMLYYELATPEVTDISDILPAGNIKVEPNGTLTFINEYKYAVPSDVTFFEGNNDVISADTFVGDLAGTAMKAVCDASGNNIETTYTKVSMIKYDDSDLSGYSVDLRTASFDTDPYDDISGDMYAYNYIEINGVEYCLTDKISGIWYLGESAPLIEKKLYTSVTSLRIQLRGSSVGNVCTVTYKIGTSVYSITEETHGAWSWIDIPVTDDIIILSSNGNWCLTGDTLITMADGTYKRIDEIQVGDMVRAIDPATNQIVSTAVTYSDAGTNNTYECYDKYTFSDGTIVKTVGRHRFYNVEKQAMTYMDEWSIGEHAYNENGELIELVSHERVYEEVPHYTIFTELNTYFANGLLSGNRFTAQITLG